VERQGILNVQLKGLDGRALLRVYGGQGCGGPAEVGVPKAPAPGFDLHFSANGAQAQLWVAQTILAAHHGEARMGAAAETAAGDTRAYEIELAVLGSPESRAEGAEGAT
jgi:hypothetical protein